MLGAHQHVLGGFGTSLLCSSAYLRIKRTKGSNIACKHRCRKSSSTRALSSTGNIDNDSTDVIIVGAGVAGAALAYALGKDGRKVHVIERDLKEPDGIVGEVLQPGGYLKLVDLGLQDCVSNIDAQRLVGYVLYKDGKSIILPYPLKKFDSRVSGMSFHNGRFIHRMREKAAAIPNVRLDQGTVTSLIEEKGTIKGVQYKTKNGPDIASAYAPLTIACDGCFSNLRRSLYSPKVDIKVSYMVGLILENCKLPSPNHNHLVLGDPSPICLYQISSTKIRVMIDIPKQVVTSTVNGNMARYLKSVVAPQMPRQLYDAFIFAVEKGKIRMMATKKMPANPPPSTPGVILIGDALNTRHPGTGGGMAVELSDVVILRDLLTPINNLRDVSKLCKYLESFYMLRKPMAFTINVLAAVLSEIYCSTSITATIKKEIRQAFFDCASRAGMFFNVPLAILAGCYPQPLILVLYLFAIGVSMISCLLLPFPSPRRLLLAARVLRDGRRIILPVVKDEGISQIFFPIIASPPSKPPSSELVQ